MGSVKSNVSKQFLPNIIWSPTIIINWQFSQRLIVNNNQKKPWMLKMQCEIVFQLLKHLIGKERNTSHTIWNNRVVFRLQFLAFSIRLKNKLQTRLILLVTCNARKKIIHQTFIVKHCLIIEIKEKIWIFSHISFLLYLLTCEKLSF